MKALKITGAAILLLLGAVCIVATVVEVCLGNYSMGSIQFWGGIAFHAITGILGIYLLTLAIPYRPKPAGEGEPDSMEDKLEKIFDSGSGGEAGLREIGDAIKEAMGEEKSGRGGDGK